MRVVGYVREPADPSVAAPVFTQQEELRRFAAERGHRLVAICQDLHSPGSSPRRDGYAGLIGVVASGAVDAVVVPRLDTFSSDTIVQEIVIWDLRSRGVKVISAEEEDARLIDRSQATDPSRMVIRDVLERVSQHSNSTSQAVLDPISARPDNDVYVQLIEADVSERTGADSSS